MSTMVHAPLIEKIKKIISLPPIFCTPQSLCGGIIFGCFSTNRFNWTQKATCIIQNKGNELFLSIKYCIGPLFYKNINCQYNNQSQDPVFSADLHMLGIHKRTCPEIGHSNLNIQAWPNFGTNALPVSKGLICESVCDITSQYLN